LFGVFHRVVVLEFLQIEEFPTDSWQGERVWQTDMCDRLCSMAVVPFCYGVNIGIEGRNRNSSWGCLNGEFRFPVPPVANPMDDSDGVVGSLRRTGLVRGPRAGREGFQILLKLPRDR
jgi:hypothetical protein